MQSLAVRQAAREPEAHARAAAKMAAIPPASARAAAALFQAARKAPRAGKRIRIILQACDTLLQPVAAVSACRDGCAHCCSLPSIIITSAEAQLLAAASGRTAALLDSAPTVAQVIHRPEVFSPGQAFLGVHCPFLADGRCSVYAARPVACRAHLNLDDDPLLCERDPAREAAVPYYDTHALLATALSAQTEQLLGDIRDFFPTVDGAAHAGQ